MRLGRSGRVEPAAGTWTDYIRKVPGEARAEAVDATVEDARIAVLHYRVRGASAGRTWLQITLETGRTHQIRLQAAIRGFPVLGDRQYGSNVAFGPGCDDERARWIALHARHLEFQHPMTHEPVVAAAPVPSAWFEQGFDVTP